MNTKQSFGSIFATVGCGIFGKLLTLSDLQFPHMGNTNDNPSNSL